MSDQTPTLYRRERYIGQPVPEGGELLSDGAPNGEPTVLIIPVVASADEPLYRIDLETDDVLFYGFAGARDRYIDTLQKWGVLVQVFPKESG